MKQLMLLLFGAGVVTAGAQSPGGVKGTELWFQTLPVTADLQGAYRWMDLAGDSVKLRSLDRSGKPGSEYTQTRSFAPAFNFHPALYLSGGSYGKQLPSSSPTFHRLLSSVSLPCLPRVTTRI